MAPTIALIAVVIAFFQWRTANQRIIMDLFDRRMKFIDGINDVVQLALSIPDHFTTSHAIGFYRQISDTEFLFGDEVVLAFSRLDAALTQLAEASAEMHDQLPSDERKALQKKQRTAIDQIRDFRTKEWRRLLLPYLRMKQRYRW
jgi:hypothetical protein